MTILTIVLYGVGVLFGLVHLVCAIMVIIKMFQRAGVGLGIVGIITCSLAAYIWGWIKAKELNLFKLMIIWTVAFILCMVSYAGVVAAVIVSPEGQKAIKEAQQKAQQQPH